jgi:transposase
MDANSDSQPRDPGATVDPRDRRILELEAQNAQLQARLARLEQLLAERDRGAKRQAAPFSKGPPRPDPKTPGRKPGDDYGTKAFRAVPDPGVIDETHDAPLPDKCPRCGGAVEQTSVEYQYQVELPRKPIHRRFNVAVGQCGCCRKRVQGRHPLQTSDALGCCASQLGPDAQTLAVVLNKQMGLSHGKSASLMSRFFKVPVTRAGVCQAMLRVAKRVEPARDAIVQQLQSSTYLVPDETGWRVGGFMAWLHAVVGKDATAYLVHPKRGYEASVNLINPDYDGCMIHDGWAAYDRFDLACHQTCLTHLIRRCRELLEACEGQRGAAGVVPTRIKGLLQEALATRDARDAGNITRDDAGQAAARLYLQMEQIVAPTKSHAGNERLCKHIYNRLDQLFVFLSTPGIDASNYRAEQAIRPAVVNRKTWGGNRTDEGAKAQGILLTVVETLKQRATDAAEWISDAIRSWPAPWDIPNPQPLPATG